MAQSPNVALYRWYNSGNGDHFYTTDPTGELAPSSGYVSEGITGYLANSQIAGAAPLYRWYNSGNGDHFYTTDPTGELAPSSGYVSEGITGYIATSQMAGTTPLYRWYNYGNGDHFYTTDPTGELAPSSGYVSEGITGYIWTAAQSSSSYPQGNQLATVTVSASPGGTYPTGGNPTRGFEDSDQVDVWVPFTFSFNAPKEIGTAKIVMVVKPIGQLIGTDQLALKGASGEGQAVYDKFNELQANQWNTVEVDLSGNSDVMGAIRTGHLDGLIQDDTAVQSVKLIISGTSPGTGGVPGSYVSPDGKDLYGTVGDEQGGCHTDPATGRTICVDGFGNPSGSGMGQENSPNMPGQSGGCYRDPLTGEINCADTLGEPEDLSAPQMGCFTDPETGEVICID